MTGDAPVRAVHSSPGAAVPPPENVPLPQIEQEPPLSAEPNPGRQLHANGDPDPAGARSFGPHAVHCPERASANESSGHCWQVPAPRPLLVPAVHSTHVCEVSSHSYPLSHRHSSTLLLPVASV